jgi:hypothetical protein
MRRKEKKGEEKRKNRLHHIIIESISFFRGVTNSRPWR